MKKIKLFTAGFTKKTAEEFFTLLSVNGIRRVVDIRLNNNSQLAGFAKQNDLKYFLKAINNIDYIYLPEFAPTKEILDQYRGSKVSLNSGSRSNAVKDRNWDLYERNFLDLLGDRFKNKDIRNIILSGIRSNDCLLCAEEKADKCHRRLVAEFIRSKRNGIEIIHL